MHVVRSRSSSAPDASVSPLQAESNLFCRAVESRAELAEHHRIRREVFVDEQHIFTGDDADSCDDAIGTLHVLGFVDGVAGGTVRLYPLAAPGLWKGDRLAVLPEHRHSGIAARLVRHAVSTAASLGGTRMVAQVQAQNTPFFVHLGWSPLSEAQDYLGVPHQWLSIGLS
jgi:putative N-acetyltransferase (TIGR04045 family)